MKRNMTYTPTEAIDKAIEILSKVESNQLNTAAVCGQYKECAHSLDILLTRTPEQMSDFAKWSQVASEWAETYQLTVALVDRPKSFELLQKVLRDMRKENAASGGAGRPRKSK